MKRLLGAMVMGALVLLTGCGGNRAKMLQQLETLEEQNHSGEPMLNDSLAESLVEYFDDCGDANERMRSRYILGRTYYCLGELPRALETYNEAINCADTTSADCDFAKLSRVYAQKADIFYKQVQPRSQLDNLHLAEYCALKGKDMLMAVECHSLQVDAYNYLHIIDSVISITDESICLFKAINKYDRAAQMAVAEITSLLKKNNIARARQCMEEYEMSSGFFDDKGDILKGREVYYYIKGEYYLAIHLLDSAEYMFRKELRDGKDLNNQIAGCKGLQKVFEIHRISDSIAKYATLSYNLNDSAYSLSEMKNIQTLQASYNYNHIKFLAEKKQLEAKVAWLIIALISFLVLVLGVFFGRRYRLFRNVALDYRLRNAEITRHLKELANSNPPQYPTFEDWAKFRSMVERAIPSFRKTLKVESLTEFEYDLCLMIRAQLLPMEMSKLKKCSPSHISTTRKRLLLQIFGKQGGSEDFDDEIGKIVN